MAKRFLTETYLEHNIIFPVRVEFREKISTLFVHLRRIGYLIKSINGNEFQDDRLCDRPTDRP